MRLNVKPDYSGIVTHEGGQAFAHLSPYQELRRTVLACLLFENQFYESGALIADRIKSLSAKVPVDVVAGLASEARTVHGLRHVPLLLLAESAKRGGRVVGNAIAATIKRPDELAEFLAVYWRRGKVPLSKQVKIGLAAAFTKFDAYSLAKYNRDSAIKLRDVLFMVHAKPKDDEQAATWKELIDGTLQPPDTWEVALSGGADKRATFERLLREEKLGYLALLRNLRNMVLSFVDTDLIRDAILARRGAQLVFPFRYVAAARACPMLETYIDQALSEAISELPVFSGRTAVLVDVSGSMIDPLSQKSDMRRIDAACALASVIHGDIRMFSFSDNVVEVPPRRGMAGVDALLNSQPYRGTRLGAAVAEINKAVPHERLIVITDEQSSDHVVAPVAKRAYMINVGANRNGIGYGKWTHIDGFSEGVIRWMSAFEQEPNDS